MLLLNYYVITNGHITKLFDVKYNLYTGTYPGGFRSRYTGMGAQKIFSGHFIFNGVLCVNLFFNQIRSKGLKMMCDCTLKLHLVYINLKNKKTIAFHISTLRRL